MSADAAGLILLAVIIAMAGYVTARVNRLKAQRETNARLAAIQDQLDAIGQAVGAGGGIRPVERMLVAERITDRPR